MSWDASDNQYIIWQLLNKNKISASASTNESHDEKYYAILSKSTDQFNFSYYFNLVTQPHPCAKSCGMCCMTNISESTTTKVRNNKSCATKCA